jgi:hypothetical protein
MTYSSRQVNTTYMSSLTHKKSTSTHTQRQHSPNSRLHSLLHPHLIPWQMIQPSLNLLLYRTLHLTRIHLIHSLRLQHTLHPRTPTSMEHTARVHHTLQRISLPSKDIVRVRPISMAISITPHERLAPILWPHIHERSRIPQRLVRELRHLYRMRRRTGASGSETPADSAGHVRLVIW